MGEGKASAGLRVGKGWQQAQKQAAEKGRKMKQKKIGRKMKTACEEEKTKLESERLQKLCSH